MSEKHDRDVELSRPGERWEASPHAGPGGRQQAATKNSAPRRVGELREERRLEPERGISWISALKGLLAALGGALLFSDIIGGIVALVALALLGSGGSETGVGISSVVGVLVTLFLVYLGGGYAAGRMASRSGAKHDLLAAPLGVLVTVVVVIGAVAGFGISDNLSGVVLPDVPEGGEQGLGSLLALSAVSGVLALLVPFIGGAMDGAWGPERAADVRR